MNLKHLIWLAFVSVVVEGASPPPKQYQNQFSTNPPGAILTASTTWSNTADNAGIILRGLMVATNKDNGVLNVKTTVRALGHTNYIFGVADDSAVIQEVINLAALQTNSLYFPAGNYRLDNKVVATNRLGFAMVGAGSDVTVFFAGAAIPDAMFCFTNVENAQVKGLTINANQLAAGGLKFETKGGINQGPSDGCLLYNCIIRGATSGYGLALGLNNTDIPQPQVNNFLLMSSKFYSSKTNVIQRSSNALRNKSINCSYGDFLVATDWNLYVENGEWTSDGDEFSQAGQYDIYSGVGSFLHIRNMYSESQALLYKEAHDPHPYPVDISGMHQNVFATNLARTVVVFNQVGPIGMRDAILGGNIYLNDGVTNHQSTIMENVNFFSGSGGGILGPGYPYLTILNSHTNIMAGVFTTIGPIFANGGTQGDITTPGVRIYPNQFLSFMDKDIGWTAGAGIRLNTNDNSLDVIIQNDLANGGNISSNAWRFGPAVFANGGTPGSIAIPAVRIQQNRFLSFLDNASGYTAASGLRLNTNDNSLDIVVQNDVANGANVSSNGWKIGILFLRDGTSKQVTFGPNDSGGAGFKYLRVPN